MTISMIRKIVSDIYPNDTWRNKVAKMSDMQVKAIYIGMKEKGVI